MVLGISFRECILMITLVLSEALTFMHIFI